MKKISIYSFLALLAFIVGIQTSHLWNKAIGVGRLEDQQIASSQEASPFNDEGPGRPHH